MFGLECDLGFGSGSRRGGDAHFPVRKRTRESTLKRQVGKVLPIKKYKSKFHASVSESDQVRAKKWAM